MFALNCLESSCQCEFSLFSHHSENFYVPVTMELCSLMVARGEPYITLVPFQAEYTFEEKESDMHGTVTEPQYQSGLSMISVISHYFRVAAYAVFHLYHGD